MSKTIKRWVVAGSLAVLAGLSHAQVVPVPFVNGYDVQIKAILSNISMDMERGEGLRRQFPFGTFLDAQRWAACRGRLSCQAGTEIEVPFKQHHRVKEIERQTSYQWNLFDARTYWHAQSRVTPEMGLCESGVNDDYLGIPTDKPYEFLPGESFCLGSDQLPPVTMIPYFCENDPQYYLDRDEIKRRIGFAYGEILNSITYPQMWDAVISAVVSELPLSLAWANPLPQYPNFSADLKDQALVLLVHNPGESNIQDLQGWAANAGAFGAAYYDYSPNNKTGSLQRQVRATALAPSDPKARLNLIYWLESLKYKLKPSRMGIHDFPGQWHNRAFAIPRQAEPSARIEEYEYMGYAGAFWFFPQRTAERTPRGGGTVIYPYIYCLELVTTCDAEGNCTESRVKKPLPPEFFDVPNYPNLNRWNTAFFSVAQGFQFKDGRAVGDPLSNPALERFSGSARTLENWLDSLSTWPYQPKWKELLLQALQRLEDASEY